MGKTYNGWRGCGTRESAWATWNVALWLDNDEGLYRLRREQRFADAHDVRAFILDVFPAGTPDMTGGELGLVSFDEIFEAWQAEEEEE